MDIVHVIRISFFHCALDKNLVNLEISGNLE